MAPPLTATAVAGQLASVLRHPRISRHRDDGLRALADEDLMGRVQDGDARAFEVIFDRHGDAAFSLAYRMCSRRPMAEDIVQEAFLSIWRSGARYDRTRGSVRSWVLGVVRNRAIDLFRRDSARTARDISDDFAAERIPAAEDTEAEVQRSDDAARVRAALDELPADQRDVIELAYFSGLTHTEIADRLAIPSGTVKGRMRLGLAKLRLSFGGDRAEVER